MHTGRRIKMKIIIEPDVENPSIGIPYIEESNHNWTINSKIDKETWNKDYIIWKNSKNEKPSGELEGRPTKVLKKFVSTGIEKKWWTAESLRNNKTFRDLIEICFGKDFLIDLEELRRERFWGEEECQNSTQQAQKE